MRDHEKFYGLILTIIPLEIARTVLPTSNSANPCKARPPQMVKTHFCWPTVVRGPSRRPPVSPPLSQSHRARSAPALQPAPPSHGKAREAACAWGPATVMPLVAPAASRLAVVVAVLAVACGCGGCRDAGRKVAVGPGFFEAQKTPPDGIQRAGESGAGLPLRLKPEAWVWVPSSTRLFFCLRPDFLGGPPPVCTALHCARGAPPPLDGAVPSFVVPPRAVPRVRTSCPPQGHKEKHMWDRSRGLMVANETPPRTPGGVFQ